MKQPADLFDPSLYQEVRQPYLEAMTLPPWCYTSEEFFERVRWIAFSFTPGILPVERTSCPTRVTTWFWRCLESRLLSFAPSQGQVNAFVNSCTHRGTRILEGQGHCRAMICPYHGWTFDHDGKPQRRARGMEKTRNFNRGDHGLTALRLETWDGFMFINFDDNAESLTHHLGDITATFSSYNFGDMACVRRKEYQP